MNCPACGRHLVVIDVSGMLVHACRDGCAGLWLERGRLRLVDESAEDIGRRLIDAVGRPQVSVDATPRRRCPVCSESVLMRHFSSAKRSVTVDECPTCAGVWLDAGELERIRAEYDSEAARRQAAQASIEAVIIDERMVQMHHKIEEALPYNVRRSRFVASILLVIYVGGALLVSGPRSAAAMLLRSLMPWACVCFPDAFSGVISPVLGTTRSSPRAFVWFLGWVVLLLPMFQLVIVWISAD